MKFTSFWHYAWRSVSFLSQMLVRLSGLRRPGAVGSSLPNRTLLRFDNLLCPQHLSLLRSRAGKAGVQPASCRTFCPAAVLPRDALYSHAQVLPRLSRWSCLRSYVGVHRTTCLLCNSRTKQWAALVDLFASAECDHWALKSFGNPLSTWASQDTFTLLVECCRDAG